MRLKINLYGYFVLRTFKCCLLCIWHHITNLIIINFKIKMTISQILYILLLGFWSPIFLIYSMYLYDKYNRYNQSRNELFRETNMREINYKILEELSYKIERKFEEMRSFIPQIIESTLEHRLSYQNHQTTAELIELRKNLQILSRQYRISFPSETSESKGENAQLIREISHSLNTPISQIEAGLINLEFEGTKFAAINKDYPEIIKSVKTSIELCKAILASYRELVLVAKSSTVWNPKSLKEIIDGSFIIYVKKIDKKFKIQNNLPNDILGYSNNYITSLLLPLIENAIEAGIPDTEIEITYKMITEKIEIEVSNFSDNIPNDNIYEDSYTTKENHSGTGLSIVQHLLTAYKGAQIAHKIQGNHITFTLILPNSK